MNAITTKEQLFEIRKYFGSEEWKLLKADYSENIATMKDLIDNHLPADKVLKYWRSDLFLCSYQEGVMFKARFDCPLMHDRVDDATNDKNKLYRFDVVSIDEPLYSENDMRRYKIHLYKWLLLLENGFIWQEKEEDYDKADGGWQAASIWNWVPDISA